MVHPPSTGSTASVTALAASDARKATAAATSSHESAVTEWLPVSGADDRRVALLGRGGDPVPAIPLAAGASHVVLRPLAFSPASMPGGRR